MQLKETRVIPLETGDNLIISHDERFYDKLRKVFELGADEIPSDEHIRHFFASTLSNANVEFQ